MPSTWQYMFPVTNLPQHTIRIIQSGDLHDIAPQAFGNIIAHSLTVTKQGRDAINELQLCTKPYQQTTCSRVLCVLCVYCVCC
jgi:hypothetical protein